MSARKNRLMADGLVAGAIGYTLVGGFFALLNLVAGRSALYTVAVIAEALFHGLRQPADVPVAAGPILAFNGIHLTAFLLFGSFSAFLTHQAELHPEFWYLALFLFLGATGVSLVAVVSVIVLVGNPLSTGSIVIAALVGAGGVAGYLVIRHRSVVRAIREARDLAGGS